MIVVSGALVLVAAGLLVDGVFFTDGAATPWQVWASIGVSVAAFLLLLAGAYRERQRPVDVAERAVLDGPAYREPTEGVRTFTAPVAPIPAPMPAPEPVSAGPAPEAEHSPCPAKEVLVVPGRPRYHLAECRHVAGRAAQPLGLAEARAVGYTPCGVCRPDGAAADEVDDAAEPAEQPGDRPVEDPGPTVVLVRGRYHRPDCRYVAVATEKTELNRADARRGGAIPCGVCLP